MTQIAKFGQRGPVAGSFGQRTVVLDIETAPLSSDEDGALSAMSGRIVCICLLVDDGCAIREIAIASDEERQIISQFWKALKPTDILVGHNLLGFDLPFIRQRSWILRIQPSRAIDERRFYTRDVHDTLELWSRGGPKKGATLDALGVALGCGGKTANGSSVAQWWAERNFQAIKSYCREDVRLAYRVYCRLTYQEPKAIADSGPACGSPREEATCCN